MIQTDIRTLGHSSEKETSLRETFFNLYKECPLPQTEILTNLGLFLNRQTLSRILFMNLLYQKIIDVHGIIIEFGVRWGQNLALFESFRGMYEPFNYNRKIVGFDTFEGFPSTDAKDGKHAIASAGAYAVTDKYEEYLEQILDYHEHESPLPHIKKYELVKGDATVEVDKYMERNPETIIALAYFDFDIYQPTKKCLEAIKDRLTKGSVIGFDELNCHEFPGETTAFKEVFGLDRFRIMRYPLCPTTSYVVID
ncbi:MAG: TylF/MycF/NovP-related O-methyltransferase [Candidatus Subteraquimicrobiales bacterium]|nr:TylF/MycF/NovP-related O-methyltransferase [Candidatus Subteraquimicrobiales bacterium]